MSFIYTLNYFLFIKFGLSIKEFVRSRFNDLKESPTIVQLAANYYTDWYASRNEADIIASIVCNVEEYFIRSVCFSFVLWVCIVANNSFLNKTVSVVFSYENERQINIQSNKFLTDFFPKFPVEVNEYLNINPIILKRKPSFKLSNNPRNKKINTGKKSRKKIKVKIIDNNTLLIKYKDYK